MWYPGEREFDEAGLGETGDTSEYGERNFAAEAAEMRSEYRYEDDERYQMSDAEIQWRAEAAAEEAHLQWLMDTYRCIRCESTNTENVTGEYDAVQVRRCFDCGERYSNEF